MSKRIYFARTALAATLLPMALSAQALGLSTADAWRVSHGPCAGCAVSEQAMWYFQEQTIAVPHRAQPHLPSLVWLGAPAVSGTAQIDAQRQLSLDGQPQAWQLAARLPSNRSWVDASTYAWLAGRPLNLRAHAQADGKLVVQTLWPRDFALRSGEAAQPLQAGESLQSLVRTQAQGPFARRVLWQRSANWQWQEGQAVLGLMLNGAQGDDDEAHGGHFAVVSGQMRADGQMGDWLVNNFYNLDSISEKGILAAPTPLDSYMADINSGQAWYRPSWMLVAVLRQDRTARTWQTHINSVYDRFYRHDLMYDHARSNCSGISMDSLRQVGWQLPEQGSGGTLKALGAYFYVAATDGSLRSGRKIYDYLREEQTRLYPARAFEAAGGDLLQLASGQGKRPLSAWEQALAEDIEAIVWVRLPQIPSSRALGQAPVASLEEFMQRTPKDRSQWKIVPVKPRPFPQQWLQQAQAQPAQSALLPWPVLVLLASPILLAGHVWRRRRAAGKRQE